MFRQHPRSPVPPSSFASGLQPVASKNLVHEQYRISRTDLNFEQALQSQETVLIREGVDVNSLGADASPSSPFPTQSPQSPRTPQISLPGTPTVVPPTPSSPTNHGAGPSSSKQLSSPTKTNDSFYTSPDDPDFQTKRRSMYRSPGSASSPDLATLLKKKKRQESASPGKPSNTMLAPDRARMRTASNTPSVSSSSPQPQFLTERFLNSPSSYESGTPDWVLTSPRGAVENGSPMKQQKTSVRAKTSAFLGKMLGQGTVRERQRQISESSPNPATSVGYSSAYKFGAFPPPVPPLPSKESTSSISDMFSSSSSSNNSKLLPLSSLRDSQESDNSIVLVDPFPQSPSEFRDYTIDSTVKAKHGKRRSLSASAAEIKPQLSSSVPSARPSGEDQNGVAAWASALNGIFTEISDPDSLSSLALRDPSSPSKPTDPGAPTSDFGTSKPSTNVDRPVFKSTLTTPISINSPTVNIKPASVSGSPLSAPLSTPRKLSPPVRPPRSSSLQTSNLNSDGQYQTTQHGLRKQSTWNGSTSAGGHVHSQSRDESHLRVQQRSNASSSEPSLVPHEVSVRDQNRNIRSQPHIGSFAYSDVVSTATSSVTPDLSEGDLVSPRYRSPPSPVREEDGDAESKARALAVRCWNEDEEFLSKEKIAEWLGRYGRINNMALGYYMENFDFSNMRLDVAFRRLCAKLFLKAETQQVDRILEALAARYWECNPNSIMRSASVVHAVVYSLLLLNTDLHVADLAARMSRNQFVRNTLSAIQMQVQSNGSNSDFDTNSIRHGSDHAGHGSQRQKRSDSITSWNSITRDGIIALGVPTPSATNGTKYGNESASSIQTSNGEPKSPEPVAATLYDRNWEIEMENLLKDMYTAIKHQQILQPLGSSLVARSSTSLTPHGTLLRNRSGRGPPDRLTTLKRGSIRGLQTILGAQAGASPYSSNSSIDGRVSPAPSFATSSEAQGSTSAFLTPTLGFASNLSHTIIRETQEDDVRSVDSHETTSTNISITDEELALLGAPWAKEGMLCRKQFWEAASKKAKVRSWMDVFVVIQKGELNMFTFGDRGGGGSGVVGGGNWLENAQPVGTLMLTHALAHALPPPGYNRQRPHCMVLTLANGGVYFFQAGTEELVNEWVSTCNYWAARQSKEPLAGGVSNMEYGWNRVVDSLTTSKSEDDTAQDNDRSDIMSVRSSRSRYGKNVVGSIRAGSSPWADRLVINDWKQPLPPSMPSTHDEEGQLESLQKHVDYLNMELQQHNELRAPMATLYSAKSANANKALTNWENKSKHLLSEIVKYQSYIDSLRHAMALRLTKRGDKVLERALVVADPEEFHWTGNPDDETVQDHGETMNGKNDPDSLTPTPTLSQLHRREQAQTGEDMDSD